MKSNKLPIPPDKALRTLNEASARAMSTAQPWPKLSPTRRVLLIAFYAVIAAAVVWLYWQYHSYVFAALPILVFAVAFGFLGVFRRCPQCRRRLVCHEEDIPGSSLYRVGFQCAHCGSTWDSGVLRDRQLDKM